MRNIRIALLTIAAVITAEIGWSPIIVMAAGVALAPDTIATGLDEPIFVTAPKRDSARIFVVELPGRIRIVKNGLLLPDPFLDISSLVCPNSENGLLGLAFDPDYGTNRQFYVEYTNAHNCDEQIVRYTCSVANPDSADPTSAVPILTIDQPDNPDHSGGSILFGPNDGYLFIPTGDGGCCGDPFGNAQNPMVLNGKVLRIDVHSGSPYAIPPTNPYFGSLSVANEIWAFGMRNPYRSAFDRQNGDLYIADVGQDAWEEVSYIPASASGGGMNLGWPILEGRHCYNPPAGCDSTGLQLPIYNYEHLGQCSITGGNVYRGCAISGLQGRYIFGDYCSGDIWSFTHNGTDTTSFLDHTADIGLEGFRLVGFGEDAKGEMYICDFAGLVYKIVPRGMPSACPSVCACACHADPRCDGQTDVLDVVGIINVAFRAQPEQDDADCPKAREDVDCNGSVDVLDVVHMVNVAFRGLDPAINFCDPCA